jgi:hypothetical protein
MPRFGTLTDQDLADVVAYRRGLTPIAHAVAAGTCQAD